MYCRRQSAELPPAAASADAAALSSLMLKRRLPRQLYR